MGDLGSREFNVHISIISASGYVDGFTLGFGSQYRYYFGKEIQGLHLESELIYIQNEEQTKTALIYPGLTLGAFVGWKWI